MACTFHWPIAPLFLTGTTTLSTGIKMGADLPIDYWHRLVLSAPSCHEGLRDVPIFESAVPATVVAATGERTEPKSWRCRLCQNPRSIIAPLCILPVEPPFGESSSQRWRGLGVWSTDRPINRQVIPLCSVPSDSFSLSASPDLLIEVVCPVARTQARGAGDGEDEEVRINGQDNEYRKTTIWNWRLQHYHDQDCALATSPGHRLYATACVAAWRSFVPPFELQHPNSARANRSSYSSKCSYCSLITTIS